MTHQMLTDEASIRGRDGLAEFRQRHPVDAHGFPGLLDGKVGDPLVKFSPAIAGTLATDGPRPTPVARMAAVDADGVPLSVGTLRHEQDRVAKLEKPVALEVGILDPKPEHCAAQHDRVDERSADNILDRPRLARGLQHRARLRHKVGVLPGVVHGLHAGMRLTRRARVDCVEAGDELRVQVQNISLNEFEWIAVAADFIDADDFEPGLMVAHSGAASAAEQVKETRPAHHTTAHPTAAMAVIRRPMNDSAQPRRELA